MLSNSCANQNNVNVLEQSEGRIASDATQVVDNHVLEHPDDVIMMDTTDTAGKEFLPQDSHDPTFPVLEQNQDAKYMTSLEHDDAVPSTTGDNLHGTPSSIPQVEHDAAFTTAAGDTTPCHHAAFSSHTQDNLSGASNATSQDKCDLAPISMAEEGNDLAPIATLKDNHDAPSIDPLEVKLAALEPTPATKLNLSGKLLHCHTDITCLSLNSNVYWSNGHVASKLKM